MYPSQSMCVGLGKFHPSQIEVDNVHPNKTYNEKYDMFIGINISINKTNSSYCTMKQLNMNFLAFC